MAYEDYCAACTYLSERADGGKYWCSRKGQNMYASDARCYSFCEAYSRSNYSRENMYDNSRNSSSSGCYLTTIMCKILNYKDDNYYLNTLRDFRDNFMKKEPKYFPLLLMYDTVGPMISFELAKDTHNKEIAESFFSRYITKAVTAIEQDKNETAVNIYKAMTEELGNHYNIDINLLTPVVPANIDIANLGHARTRIPQK